MSVIAIDWCANCGDHALAHYDEWDPDTEEWVEGSNCRGWRYSHTTTSDGPRAA